MTISDIRNILEAPYNRKVWKSFIQTQFTNNNLLANDAPLNLGKSDLYTDCYSLGNYAIDDYTKIGIFEIQLADKVNLTRNRVALRNLIKSITQQVAGAMVVFVQGDKWRFSYISKRKIRNKETNTVEDKETAPKRYTYLFGKGEKALTASIRFDRLIQKQQGNLYQFLTLNDFEEAFSVEKLSKEFFAQYKEIYDDFVEFITGKRYIKKGSKWVETPTHEAHFQLRNYFNNDEKQARDFFKRMMGRIVFLYFIQKKGWLSVPKTKQWGEGNPDYLFELYKNAKYKDSFYSEYLVPLFFDTLNNVDVQKESNEFRFPYLNGGLFDKAQDFKYDKIALPSEIFDKLFTTFNNYNFTIYEDAPDEHTVAVDPEMLGHIFENLLEDNKDKGAFYTPKDIVHYMCRESLHNYIFTYTGNEENEDFKAKLKLYNDTFDISIFDKDEIKLIDRALEDVKICDPAIGSGAFPMGLLHEIYHLKIPIEDSKGMKAKSPADLKKHIIEESIYGVDIDSGAVDIARLRFWLSLVVDEVAPQPLPNLAFKIVCANTLIPLGKPKSDLSGSLDIAKAIEKLRHDYFDASKEDKKDLERQFKNLQNKLWATAKEWVSKEDGDIYLKISEFNPFEDKSCTWFDAWWMFGVKDGFDIVIGNPPYVFSRGNLSSEDKKLYKNHYSLTQFKINLYILFIEKGTELLKKNGCNLFISPQIIGLLLTQIQI
ncbi:MAG: Eco57I restriction-modification methylase domain-containing protein [Saprospiraceae bacterium]|nr:Eco57I restriction-modification methylase domain-containing protein [Saprospiraceae bacterium]